MKTDNQWDEDGKDEMPKLRRKRDNLRLLKIAESKTADRKNAELMFANLHSIHKLELRIFQVNTVIHKFLSHILSDFQVLRNV